MTNTRYPVLSGTSQGPPPNPRAQIQLKTGHLEINRQILTLGGTFLTNAVELRVNGLSDPSALHELIILYCNTALVPRLQIRHRLLLH